MSEEAPVTYTDEDARRWSEHVKIWDLSPAADGLTSAAQHTPAEIVRQVADAIEAEGRLLPLEAGTRTEVEWGFRCTDECGLIHPEPEAVARRMAKHAGRALVNRLCGPWIEVTDG